MFDQHPRSLIATPFRPVDIDAVGRRLKLLARGREDGAKELPDATAVDLAAAELDVIADIGADRDRCVEQLAGQLRAIQGALSQIDTHMDIAKVRQDTATALADFQRIAHGIDTELAQTRGRAAAARVEFERFRGQHRLDRAPRVPARRNELWLWLVVMTLLETVLNGVFLAAGSDQGLLGGMVIAIGLSIVNVWMIGMLGGLVFLRGAHRREPWIKLPCLLLFIVVLAAVVGLNLFVVHVRDMDAALAASPDPSAILADLLARPLYFRGIESLLLFALGLGCAGLAIWKFFGHDDPYPGYGAMHRRLRAAQMAHAEARRTLLDEATDVRDAALADLTRAMDTMRAYAQQRADALASRARYVTLYEAHEAELEHAARRLLAMFRGANLDARRTAAPEHFRTAFKFADQGIRHAAIRALLTDPPAPPDASALVRELETLRDSALAGFTEVIALLPAEAP